MKTARKIISLVIVLMVVCGALFASGSQSGAAPAASGSSGAVSVDTLPRKETLYYNGLQWGAPGGNNPYGNSNNAFIGGERQLQFETLFLYNMLDGKLYPQIGDSYAWSGQNLTVKLNQNVKFSDGSALTAADVVNSFVLAQKYSIAASGYWAYLDSVSSTDNYTVVFKGKPSNFNPKYVEAAISAHPITSKAYWDKQNLSSDPSAMIQFVGWDVIGTGPYLPYFHDDTKMVIVRNDNYWGKHASRYGKLPTPKYVAHNVYKDNTSGDEAFRAGQVDMSQQFITQVWRIWESGAPVETYIPQAPYYFPGVIPMIIFNTTKPGLNDPAVRRAIAMSLDYDMIGTNAMSGYTAKMVPSLMLPVPAEQALIDTEALKPYQWSGVDIAGANKLLDQAGWVRGADGIRAKGGVKLSFKAECPYGWADWNASLEVVAQSGRALGMDIQTYFPESPIWQQDKDNTTFDILMDSPGGTGAASPWTRAYAAMGSQDIPPAGTPNRVQNWGRWVNQEANQIINQLASETDAAKVKQLWTRLNIIYLQEMPTAGLMYRPGLFHTVNTSVWTGFPKINDGSNIPPTICCDGYGIKALYNLKAK
ncbi:ABC transporter substrate-binding protein [Leadbettera azotonutricia]|uniref:Putative extracellular solute-binding protein, family 5 n=1 Tax=Leadbettera azotonutricia (strain ATCC BAA-888 / DSM 13862 / ZAS-9) TaxID=545695 RepID=F5Y6S7_LEAAZ|nr:ABC transporter substrate-binding protein [Leadbettera azotonutricia]AEF82454.1 putative extracellular solute-binding protein, family 5 [Leadbettera azotonutricia ZAS-9]